MLDPRSNHLDKENFQLFDPFRSGGKWAPGNFADDSENHEEQEMVQLRLLESEEDSGIHSPPLWKNPSCPTSPTHPPGDYGCLSPTSRRQAIVRGQRELMDMVKNLPESCYELSLKDLVLQPRPESQEECLLKEKAYNNGKEEDDDDDRVVVHWRVNSERQGSRRGEDKRTYSATSMRRKIAENNKGLFLKMVFPVGNKSVKKNKLLNTSTSKVTPKPEASGKAPKNVDKDWWKKRFSTSGESDSSSRSSSRHSGSNTTSGGSRGRSDSSSSCSSSIRERRRVLMSWMTCFHSSKGQSPD